MYTYEDMNMALQLAAFAARYHLSPCGPDAFWVTDASGHRIWELELEAADGCTPDLDVQKMGEEMAVYFQGKANVYNVIELNGFVCLSVYQ